VPKRAGATLAALTATAAGAVCLSAGSNGAPAAASSTRGGGVADTAEVVLGTLTAPPSPRFLARVRRGAMGGVLLLGNGWLTRATAAAVTGELQAAACTRGEPLLIAVDQEGGIVRRLAWAPPTQAPAEMSSPADARRQGAGAAAALRSVGIDVDLAPVADTPSVADSFLGSRAFSRSRTWNARLTAAFVQGLQRNGVAATAKHFPGLGLAGGNTDDGRIVIDAAAWKLRLGLGPFRSAIRAGAKLVMLSTAIYPQLDPTDRPAAFSPAIATGLLRRTLGFTGVAVTDSLTAPAAEAIPHAPRQALLAGSDLLVFGAERASARAVSALAADAAGSARLRARLAQAAGRVRALKAWLATHGGPACTS